MKKLLSCLMICILITTMFAACSSSNTDEIKIGINYELSGENATYGQGSVEGIELAIEEINAAGGINGKKLSLLNTTTSLLRLRSYTILANKLVSQDKVLAILGPATTGCFTSEIPVANKNKVPIATGSATGDNVTFAADGSVHEYVFRICFFDSFQGQVMANFAAENLSAKNAAIIMDSSSDYGKGLAENFVKTFTESGGNIVAQEAYVAGDTDFNAILTKIKALNSDVIYIPGYYNEAGLIIKQARNLGLNQPILGADGFDSPTLVDLAGAIALICLFYKPLFFHLMKIQWFWSLLKLSKPGMEKNQMPLTLWVMTWQDSLQTL